MTYKVVFSLNAYIKFQAFINKVNTEISGMAKVTKNKSEGIFYVEDIILLPQIIATGVYTKINNGKFYDDIMAQGGEPSDYKCWWHSHVSMPVFWSGTDLAAINDLDIELPEDNWFLSIVGNKHNEILCRLDIFDPIRLVLDKLPWEIDFSDIATVTPLADQVDSEIETCFAKEIPILLPLDKANTFRLKLPAGQDDSRFPRREIIIPDEL